MHRYGAWAPALLLLVLAGCFTSTSARPGNWLERANAGAQGLRPDCVVLDIVVVEQRLGDPFLNRELWGNTDEQIVGLEHKVLLEDNGFRVGHLIGAPPEALQDLLNTKRYWFTNRRQLLGTGKSTTVVLGPKIPQCRFTLNLPGRRDDVTLADAQPHLILTPTLTKDGRTTVRFTPQWQHGQDAPDIQAAPDRTGWQLEYHRPQKTYPDLDWEVTVAPGELILVGAYADDPESLGGQCLVQADGAAPVQRLLVLRTTRNLPGFDEGEDNAEGAVPASPLVPPLALQASWSCKK